MPLFLNLTCLLGQRLDNINDILVSLALETQQLVIQLLKLALALWVEDGSVEIRDKGLVVVQPLGKPLVSLGGQVVELDLVDCPLVGRVGLLGQGEKLVLREDGILNVDDAVLCLFGVTDDTEDGIGDTGESGGAELAVTAVDNVGRLVCKVNEEVVLNTPVEEGSVIDKGVRERCGFDVFLDLDLAGKHGQFSHTGLIKVGTELGWDDSLNSSGDSGIDESILVANGCGSEGRDDDILALEGSSEGLEGRVVNFDDICALGECRLGAGALEDADIEVVGLSEAVEDRGA